MNYTTSAFTPVTATTERDSDGGDYHKMRDEFARAALTGILAGGVNHMVKSNTEMAYRYADAMMEARQK